MVQRQIRGDSGSRAVRASDSLRSSGVFRFARRLAAAGSVLLLASTPAAFASTPDAALVERGRYLAAAGNCVSCHTREGGQPFAGGLAFATPFGTMYSTNITQDPETGIGKWSEQEFARAVREGVRPGGEHLYPAFPYPAFTKISDEDVAALFAYMKTVQPVKYAAPANELKFPFNQRWALGIWKAMYFEAGRFEPDTTRSAQWNRGAYLVEGLGHCSACHSPRNFMGAEKADLAMTGGVYKDKIEGKLLDWSATNLTSAPSGLGAWSEDDIAAYLKYGFSERAGVFGPMNDVIVNSTSHLSEEDTRAMAVYLKSLRSMEQPVGAPPSKEAKRAGENLYDVHCGTCHLPTGLGSSDSAPPLAASAVALAPDPASLINVILYSPQKPKKSLPVQDGVIRKWKEMEPFGEQLTDEEVAALASYVRSAWGNAAGAVSPAQVAKQR